MRCRTFIARQTKRVAESEKQLRIAHERHDGLTVDLVMHTAKLAELEKQATEQAGSGADSVMGGAAPAQELKLLLEDIPDNSAMACKVCTGRGVASLVVALMDECGEDRHATRNDILACLASLVRFVPGSELSSDGRLWALLMRMLYQRDEASVYHALRAMSHLGAKPESLQTLRAARRMPAIMTELARSPHPNVAAAALRRYAGALGLRGARRAVCTTWAAAGREPSLPGVRTTPPGSPVTGPQPRV